MIDIGLARTGIWLGQYAGPIVVVMFLAFALLEITGVGHGAPIEVGRARMSTNFGLQLTTSILALAVPTGDLGAAIFAAEHRFGLFHRVPAPWFVVIVAAMLVRTLVLYWLHRAFHAVPLFWRIHRVHHSDTHFDLTLALRNHPIEYLLNLGVFGLVTLLLGLPPWAAIMLDLLMIAANFWEHVDRRVSPNLARRIGYVLVMPAAHRIHHSAARRETDSNFGGFLTVWDRLFGTWRNPQRGRVARIGLGPAHDATASNLGFQLAAPFDTTPSQVRRP